MQVGPNQEFEVEFMSGHSSTNTYFAIVRHEDEKQLKFHGQNMFEKYIAQAPEGTVPLESLQVDATECISVFWMGTFAHSRRS